MRAGAAQAFIPDGDIRSLRAFHATAKAAGGILDLVMPMRVGGDGPALFCVHPLIGLSWCYLPLLPHVDASYPLYGLQARGVRRPEPLPVTMAEMAQDYADPIRKIQPAGPHHGWRRSWKTGGRSSTARSSRSNWTATIGSCCCPSQWRGSGRRSPNDWPAPRPCQSGRAPGAELHDFRGLPAGGTPDSKSFRSWASAAPIVCTRLAHLAL
jgi:hypothetical protein